MIRFDFLKYWGLMFLLLSITAGIFYSIALGRALYQDKLRIAEKIHSEIQESFSEKERYADNKYFSILLFVLFGIINFIGFGGIANRSHFSLCLFNTFILLLFVCFCLYILVAYLIRNKEPFIAYACEGAYIKNLDNEIIDAYNVLCHDSCPCYQKEGTKIKDSVRLQVTNNPNDPINIQGCIKKKQISLSKDLLSMLEFLQYFEENHDCAGICTPLSHFVFTDVNRAHTNINKTCTSAYFDNAGYEYFEFKIVRIIIIFLTLLLLITFILNCCLYNHPEFDRKNEIKNKED